MLKKFLFSFWVGLIFISCSTSQKATPPDAFSYFQQNSVSTSPVKIDNAVFYFTGAQYLEGLNQQIRSAKSGDQLEIQQFYVRKGKILAGLQKELKNALDKGVQVQLQLDFLFSLSAVKSFDSFKDKPGFALTIFNPPSAKFSQFLKDTYQLQDPDQAIDQIISADVESLKLTLKNSNLGSALDTAPPDATPEVVLGQVLKKVVEETSWFSMLKLKSGLDELSLRSHTKHFRMHSKSLPQDTIFIGGRGWADNFVSTKSPELTYADMDMRFELPVNSQTGRIPAVTYLNSKAPEDSATDFEKNLVVLIDSARSTLQIYTPYFTPSSKILNALKRASDRKVEIDVFTNSTQSSDVPIVPIYTYENLQRWKEDIGEHFHFHTFTGRKKECFHAKLAVVDDILLWVGTGNWDLRSFLLDTNSFVVLDLRASPELQKQVKSKPQKDLWAWHAWSDQEIAAARNQSRTEFGEKVVTDALHSLDKSIVLHQL